MEETSSGSGAKSIYNGRKLRRICLVLDCLTPNDFTNRTRDLVNLQHHVIRQKKLSEKETLVIFYAVIEIVCTLHEKKIVHRDLKLGNIVLDKRSNKVTITNFCLGKPLMNDTDLLKDQRGSPAYISPDVLSGKPYLGKPSDMWALGVVLFTMLYGRFPFYDNAPHELFQKIKVADYTLPDDGRVSEDTKSLIRKLLITNPKERMTASQVKDALESIISMWRSISAPTSYLQIVPEYSEEEAKAKAEKEKAERVESENTDLLLKLMQQVHKPALNPGQSLNKTCPGPGPIKVTRLSSDARPLTADDYRMYGNLVSKLRQGDSIRATSTTGRPILEEPGSNEPVSNEQLLISSRSPLLLASLRRSSTTSTLAPPIPAEPAAVPVPVIEQESVLDLSLTTNPVPNAQR